MNDWMSPAWTRSSRSMRKLLSWYKGKHSLKTIYLMSYQHCLWVSNNFLGKKKKKVNICWPFYLPLEKTNVLINDRKFSFSKKASTLSMWYCSIFLVKFVKKDHLTNKNSGKHSLKTTYLMSYQHCLWVSNNFLGKKKKKVNICWPFYLPLEKTNVLINDRKFSFSKKASTLSMWYCSIFLVKFVKKDHLTNKNSGTKSAQLLCVAEGNFGVPWRPGKTRLALF